MNLYQNKMNELPEQIKQKMPGKKGTESESLMSCGRDFQRWMLHPMVDRRADENSDGRLDGGRIPE